MIRLIFSSKRWHSDLEWGRKPREEPAEAEEAEVHELEAATHIDPETTDLENEESVTPIARRIIGFQPNREENNDGK